MPAGSQAEDRAPNPEEKPSYGQILKSSAMIGGSSVVVIAIGIIRTKAMAILLGPAGFGLMALYTSIVEVAMSLAGMGVGSSGVRQIADANGSGDRARIANTITVLRRLSLWLGIAGGILVVVFAPQISRLTFGSELQTAAVALLSLGVLFRVVNAGQAALIQGLRRIGDLALMGVLGALLGTGASIVLVYFMGESGVAPAVVATAGMTLFVSWWYSRRVRIESPSLEKSVVRQETSSLLKLGFAFMSSGFLMMGSAYAVRAIVLQGEGLEAAGFYQAAWTLGGLYVGMILQAMGADFYPRLTAAATRRQADKPPRERAGSRQHAACRSRGRGDADSGSTADDSLLYRRIRRRGGGATVDLPGYGPSCYHVANGLHHRGPR